MHFISEQTVPLYSGKQMASGDVRILSANKSFLFRNRITDVSINQRLLQIESNSFMLSAIRFCQQKYHCSLPDITSSYNASHRICHYFNCNHIINQLYQLSASYFYHGDQ